jgi:hypothetical protein
MSALSCRLRCSSSRLMSCARRDFAIADPFLSLVSRPRTGH